MIFSKLAAVLVFTAVTPLAAQAQKTCDCRATLDSVISEVQRNYAGYTMKVTAANRAAYDKTIFDARAEAAKAANALECQRVLNLYVAFLQDRHIAINYKGPAVNASVDTVQVRAQFASSRTIALTEAQARQRLVNTKHPIEGIWRTLTQPEYRVAIFRDPGVAGDTLVGVVLKADSVYWMPGQVKMLLAANDSGYAVRYFMRDHSEQNRQAIVAQNMLLIGDLSTWVRVWPETPSTLTPEAYVASLNTSFRIDDVGNNTLVVHLPSFDNPFAARIDSLFEANAGRLRKAENLIIDVRGNGGGSDRNYRHLLPLLYTHPIVTKSVAMYATPDNIRRAQAVVDDPKFPAGARAGLQARIDSMKKHVGQFMPEPDHTWKADSVMTFPRRVAVLMDRGCGSSCEQFVLAARQSRKVTLYGDNTAGVLDFANQLSVQLPCEELELRYASSRSNRLPHDPVDPMGIAPRVRIPRGELQPIEFVRKHMVN